MRNCTSEELKEVLQSKKEAIYFIDVRTPEEYEKGHIEGFINIPLGAEAEVFEEFKEGVVYMICLSGGRSEQACTFLDGMGFQDVISVEGGMLAWREKGFPVVEGG